MNILIVGLGSIGTTHINALKFLKIKANIYALRSSKYVREESNIKNIFDIESVDFKFDFVIVSNPTHLHYTYIKKFAKLGIPLFIEKPLVHSLQYIDELLKIINEKSLINYVACNLRFHPCIKFLKKELPLKKLQINEVNVYCGSYLPDWRPGKNFREFYSVNPEMGGGVHLDLFHELDYVFWLFGYPKKSQSVLRNVSSLEIEAIDYANYILEYDGFTTSIILNYYRRNSKREIEIVFDNTIWKIDLIENTIKDDKGSMLFKAENFQIINTYNFQMNYFIKCLLQNKLPMNDINESSEVLKIVFNNEK